MLRTEYWNRGVTAVPYVTGAAKVMDCSDLLDALKGLEVALPVSSLLDVGCGTGRLSSITAQYVGLDIALDAVNYCKHKGLESHLIYGPEGVLMYGWFDMVVAMSVFTHIDADERRAYLRAFREVADNVVVDVIPGDGRGNIALWTADVSEFTKDVISIGWDIVGAYERRSPDCVSHLYYRLRSKQ